MVAQTTPFGQPQGVSLRPSDAVAGGLIDNANLLVKEASFAMFDYNSSGAIPAVPAAHLKVVADDDTEYDQWYSCGDAKSFMPSADGTQLLPIGSVTGLNRNCNFVFLLEQAVAAGFPEAQLTADIRCLVNLYAHWRRTKQPERAGLTRAPANPQNAGREQTTLIPVQIINLPGEPSKRGTPQMAQVNASIGNVGVAAVGAGQAAQAAGGMPVVNGAAPTVAMNGNGAAPTPAPAAGVTFDDLATNWLVTFLDQPPFTVTQGELAAKAFAALATDPNRDGIIQALYGAGTFNLVNTLAATGRIRFDPTSLTYSKAG